MTHISPDPICFPRWLALAGFLLCTVACHAGNTTIGAAPAKSQVPAWDVHGTGALPWQGISCVDMTADGRFVAIGTIAPQGDPQVLLLDENGKLAGQYHGGERWINNIAVGEGGSFIAALYAVPTGAMSDRPAVKIFSQGKEVAGAGNAVSSQLFNYGDWSHYGDWFHYGEHSNHLASLFQALGDRLVVAQAGGACWNTPIADAKPQVSAIRNAGAGLACALAASPGGRVVIGRAVRQGERTAASANLSLLEAGQAASLWNRPVYDAVDTPPALEKGLYDRSVPAYTDVKVWAPLSVAIDASGKRVAAADYQGWNRQFANGYDAGIRYPPTRPTIQVYDETGQLVRRFGPETFPKPFWCDLTFTPDGARLLVSPHNWASRGLGGLGVLPADDDMRTLTALTIATGAVDTVTFPDAIASVSVGGNGRIAVGCWDHRVYLLDERLQPLPGLETGIDAGTASLVRASRDGARVLIAGVNGQVRMVDAGGKTLWQNDLNATVPHGDKPWVRNQALGKIGPGVWCKGGARTQSDMGMNYFIEAPEGLLLIDTGGGLGFESYLAQVQGSGLDPMKVKYVLLTHEHGDHAPGANLWRLLTGAQVVASPEFAYGMRHEIPSGTAGYGFNPPIPVDISVTDGQELTLAGLKVRVLQTPGHTSGSVSYLFDVQGKRYVATGDLIMPGGTPGYVGNLEFCPQEILASLRKIAPYKPDIVLCGHGEGDSDNYIGAGIRVAEATGWGKMTPEKPDPFYGFAARNYLIAGWVQPFPGYPYTGAGGMGNFIFQAIRSAAFGDIDGDTRPDIALFTQTTRGAAIQIYLNAGGKFSAKPDFVQEIPGLEPMPMSMAKIRLLRLNDDKIADIFASSENQAVVLISQEGKLQYRVEKLPSFARPTQALVADLSGKGRSDLIIGTSLTNALFLVPQEADGTYRTAKQIRTSSNFDLAFVDVNGDKQPDLITSGGEIFLRQADGSLPDTPSIQLHAPVTRAEPSGWVYMAAADFNHDTFPDIVLLTNDGNEGAKVCRYDHTGDAKNPYRVEPTATFMVKDASAFRDGLTVGDWNLDGIPDLVLCSPQGATILLGSAQGLGPEKTVAVKLEYAPAFDNKFVAADFNGDGKMDLANWGFTQVGAGGAYIWLQP